jgi:hypothetical protein
MMPIHNVFNEWYAAQTSKKICAVWKSKTDYGERISATGPYGYCKSEDNPKQWVIDEAASRYISEYEPVFLYLYAQQHALSKA